MGGSQGAHAINQVIMEGLEDLIALNQQIQIVHQTGKADYKKVQECYANSSLGHLVKPFFDSIEEIYSITDLMVCRAGGMTVSELTACGIPAIFIPLPAMTGNNQQLNAQAVSDRGAAIVLDQSRLTGAALANDISHIITNSSRLRQMADASRSLGNPHASEEIAKSIYSLLNP